MDLVRRPLDRFALRLVKPIHLNGIFTGHNLYLSIAFLGKGSVPQQLPVTPSLMFTLMPRPGAWTCGYAAATRAQRQSGAARMWAASARSGLP